MNRSLLSMLIVSFVGLSTCLALAQLPEGRGGGRPGGGRPGEGRPGEGGRGDFRPPPNPLLQALDKDGNNEISAEEIAAASAALRKLDQNGDKKITLNEIQPRFGRGGERGRGGPEGRGRPGDRGRPEGRGGPDGRGRPGDRGGPEGRGRPEDRGAPQGGRDNFNPEELIERLLGFDENEDGKLSEDELPERMRGLFERFDENTNGVLDKSELAAIAERRVGRGREGDDRNRNERGPDDQDRGNRRPPQGRDGPEGRGRPGEARPGEGRPGRPEEVLERLLSMDENEDGKLSEEELPGRMRGLLERLDSNEDGALDKAELLPFAERMAARGREGDNRSRSDRGPNNQDRENRRPPEGRDNPEGRGGPQGRGRPGQGRPGEGRPVRLEEVLERLLSMDENEDGKLSEDELPGRMRGLLERLDSNEDGALDKAELLPFAERMAARGREGDGRSRSDRGPNNQERENRRPPEGRGDPDRERPRDEDRPQRPEIEV